MKSSILHKTVRLLSIVLPIGLVLFLVAVTFFFFSNSYTSFIQDVLDSIQRPDLEKVLREQYFPLEKFDRIKWWLLLSSVVSAGGLSVMYRYKEEYHRQIDGIASSGNIYLNKLKLIYLSFSKTGRIALGLLLFILLCRSVYFATTFYIQFDEAWNYNFFLDKQIFYSIGAYNNYPLHNIVSWCFVHLLGSSVLVLRMPSFLIGLFCTFFIALGIQHFVRNEKIALLSAGLFSCLPVSLFYMLYARGVMFEILFALLVCILILQYGKSGFTFKRILFLSLLNALGTYSMVSHPYFIVSSFAAMLIFSVLYERKNSMMVIAYGFFSMLFSLVMMIPMMLGTGLSPVLSVLSNHQAVSIKDIISYVEKVSFFITGFRSSFYLFFLMSISLLVYFFKKNRRLCMLSLFNSSLLLLPLFIPWLTNVYPPERAISFLVLVPLSYATLVFYMVYQMNVGRFILYPFALLGMVVFSYKAYTHPFLNWSRALDKQVAEVAILFKQENVNRVYNDCRDFGYFIPGIEFYFRQQHMSIEFNSSSKISTRYTSTIDSTIQYVVFSKQSFTGSSLGDSQIYALGDVMIFKRKQ